jgi:hypothetical protein
MYAYSKALEDALSRGNYIVLKDDRGFKRIIPLAPRTSRDFNREVRRIRKDKIMKIAFEGAQFTSPCSVCEKSLLCELSKNRNCDVRGEDIVIESN